MVSYTIGYSGAYVFVPPSRYRVAACNVHAVGRGYRIQYTAHFGIHITLQIIQSDPTVPVVYPNMACRCSNQESSIRSVKSSCCDSFICIMLDRPCRYLFASVQLPNDHQPRFIHSDNVRKGGIVQTSKDSAFMEHETKSLIRVAPVGPDL
jgi:hypothetical protein